MNREAQRGAQFSRANVLRLKEDWDAEIEAEGHERVPREVGE